jgi:hypothetical protein
LIKDILEKYNAKPNGWGSFPRTGWEYEYKNLCNRWRKYVPRGWYGFELADVPMVWYKIINEALEYFDTKYKLLEIHQIKLKYGGLRFYILCERQNNECLDEIDELEDAMYDERLIW